MKSIGKGDNRGEDRGEDRGSKQGQGWVNGLGFLLSEFSSISGSIETCEVETLTLALERPKFDN